jgi:hypothetical protein
MARIVTSGLDELVAQFRTERDGLDCVFNLLVNIQVIPRLVAARLEGKIDASTQRRGRVAA